jgi:DNA invertase Pin-like site-specific DNA recombinase
MWSRFTKTAASATRRALTSGRLDALCKDAAPRPFDVVMAWSVDRLGRSERLDQLRGRTKQSKDRSVPASTGKAMLRMMGVFAEFERSMIQERVGVGLRERRRQERNSAPRKSMTNSRPRSVKPCERARWACTRLRLRLGSGPAPCSGSEQICMTKVGAHEIELDGGRPII